MKNPQRSKKSSSGRRLRPLGTSSCAKALVLAAASPSARAADVYWDTNGATVGASSGTTASGTWDAATTGNWTTSPTGVLPTSNYFIATGSSPSTGDVIFSAGSNVTALSTITINDRGTLTGVTANSIRIKNGSIATATSGTFTAGPVLTLGGGGLTIDATTTGVSSFNTNTWVGLAASQQWNNNSSFLFTNSGTITSLAAGVTTLTVSGTGTGGSTFVGVIANGASGTTAININTTGGGINTLSNQTNTFTGGVTLSQGILRLSQSSATGSTLGGGGGLTLGGGELRLVRSGNTNGTTFNNANTTVTGNVRIVSEVGSGSNGVTHTMGTLTAGSQTITVGAGSMVANGTAGVTFGATSLTGSTTFDIESSTQLTLGALTGASAINKQGVGKLTLSGSTAAFSGGLNINEGTINVANAAALGAGAGTINLGANAGSANATLEFGTSFGTYAANPIYVQSGAGTRTITATGGTSGATRKIISGAITLANDLTISNQATHSGNSGVEFSGGVSGTGNLYLDNSPAPTATSLFLTTNTINNVGSITNSGSSTTQILAAIGANVTQVNHSGPGTLVLGGTNTAFAGGLTVNSGTVRLNSTTALSTANTAAVGGGAVLDMRGVSVTGYDLSVAGLNNVSGTGGHITNTTAALRTITLGGSGTYSFSGSIASSTPSNIALVKNGSGTQILGGVNTFTGTTTVTAGTLLIEGSLASSAVSVTGGILGGSGTMAGTVSIGSGGSLSPGSSPGTLTIASNLNMLTGSNLLFEGGDLVSVNNQLDLDDNWTLTLGSGFADGGSVVLFNFGTIAATPDLLPTFDIDDLGFTPTGPLSLSVVGNSVVLNGISVVPEPSTAILAGAGLALVLARVRRTRRS